ncbi:hypothetical protein STRCI_001289 [Streptomyces cinnabarinus]|uniref:Uncharacterized protein n=1 Tax=Streptomyces cinnabarinus TaxID=67287 RepID=A0ABY7K6R5_9ACTN|nr:hypothetical protein [Streptomyces cinnabarinus]WAZ20190.1 hypothetical protein STRCI_001289 [Streptomyces cinnabarinus]
MADREDEMLRVLALGISQVYSILVDICGLLPVPLRLPVEGRVSSREAVPAVIRVDELAADQPMGEDQAALLHTGCIHWLAAIDLYTLCSEHEYRITRIEGISANLLYAEDALGRLHLWLLSSRN